MATLNKRENFMNKILNKKALTEFVTLMEVEAPLIAKKAKPGQFIILRVDENSERIPLTIADYNIQKGTITIIFQIVGASTINLNKLQLKKKKPYLFYAINKEPSISLQFRNIELYFFDDAVTFMTEDAYSVIDKNNVFLV